MTEWTQEPPTEPDNRVLFFGCPSCGGEGWVRREADPLDYVDGTCVCFGEVETRCFNCWGRGEVEGSYADIEEWGEPIRLGPIPAPESPKGES